MGLFSRSKVPVIDANTVSNLLARVGELESTVRRLEVEQVSLHEQVMKRLRRAVAWERNQARLDADEGDGAPAEPPAPTLFAPADAPPWGARARRMARLSGGSNGVHP